MADDLKKHWKSISRLAITAKQELSKKASGIARKAKSRNTEQYN
jgi:hypothetical protein